jgi:mannose/fructose/N-acetylgalactosamine-specific phosphotransferase system component IID
MDVASRTLHVLVPRQVSIQWSLSRDLIDTNDFNQSQGSAREKSNSASSVVTTLVPTLLVACAIFVAFLILRRKHSRIYNPRAIDGVVDK